MSYLLQCKHCRATAWVGAWTDWETNSVDYQLDGAEWDWEEDEPTAEELLCEHSEFECVDFEYDYDDPSWYE